MTSDSTDPLPTTPLPIAPPRRLVDADADADAPVDTEMPMDEEAEADELDVSKELGVGVLDPMADTDADGVEEGVMTTYGRLRGAKTWGRPETLTTRLQL